MGKYRSLAGALGALPAFESAARLMSFTKAAEELGLTQPAISRRISKLEWLLGVDVFQRSNNRLDLTAEGRQLLEAVELGLGHLNEVVGQIVERSKERKLTIACGFSFAAMWLQPRFTRFRHMLDGMEVHLIASEFPDDLNPNMIDIRILWFDKAWPDRDMRSLFSEDVCPVCSPSFAEAHELPADGATPLKKISELPLLHCDFGKPGYLDWTQWFRLHGIDYAPANPVYLYDNYQFAVQAALDGEGIVFGYSVLIDSLLSRGSLVQIGPKIHHRDATLYIEFEPNRISKTRRDKIFEWLRQEAGYRDQ